jgi:hypothetical protein
MLKVSRPALLLGDILRAIPAPDQPVARLVGSGGEDKLIALGESIGPPHQILLINAITRWQIRRAGMAYSNRNRLT